MPKGVKNKKHTSILVKNIFFDKSMKEQIFEIVNNNAHTIIADIEEQDFGDSMSIGKIEEISVIEQGVDFYCGGKGISPS